MNPGTDVVKLVLAMLGAARQPLPDKQEPRRILRCDSQMPHDWKARRKARRKMAAASRRRNRRA